MSETLPKVFNEFVKKAKDQLASIDEKYSSEDDFKEECLKYLEKVDVYKNFTERLIEEGTKYLDVISHLNEELSKNDADTTSTSSGTVLLDEKIFEDFEFLRKCVEKRACLEEEAMSSLVHLQDFVEKLVADKHKLANENHDLLDFKAKIECNDSITSSAIATLTQENEELKEIIERNKETMKLVPDKESTTSDNTADDSLRSELDDCIEKLKELQRQIKEKDKIINHLQSELSALPKSRDDLSKASVSSSSESKESIATQSSRPKKHHQRSQSDVSKSTKSSGSHELTDNEKSDNEKLRIFKDAYKEMTLILKEKYQQLREQRATIAELLKRIQELEGKDEEIMELLDESVKLRNKNESLNDEVLKLKDDPKVVDELKKQSENLNTEIETLKEREILLARKLAIQEAHIFTFREERQNLMKINNDMLCSIAACKKELAKFNVKYPDYIEC